MTCNMKMVIREKELARRHSRSEKMSSIVFIGTSLGVWLAVELRLGSRVCSQIRRSRGGGK